MGRLGIMGSQLTDLARYLLQHGPRKSHPTPRRVRVIHNHTCIVDTIKAVHVWEHDAYPQYYLPVSELRNSSWKDKQMIVEDGLTSAAVVELTVPGPNGVKEKKTDRVIRFADDPRFGVLAGMVRVEFSSMDQWLEEDSPIYVHPKDPFKRIDTLPSTRTIEVKLAGTTLAKSSWAVHLHETGLPARYYLPLTAVDQSLLRKSDLLTRCPYKGEAEYYHVVLGESEADVHKNLVWYYRFPTHESAAIAGLVCFYNEKVDIEVDGVLQDRPKTSFT